MRVMKLIALSLLSTAALAGNDKYVKTDVVDIGTPSGWVVVVANKNATLPSVDLHKIKSAQKAVKESPFCEYEVDSGNHLITYNIFEVNGKTVRSKLRFIQYKDDGGRINKKFRNRLRFCYAPYFNDGSGSDEKKKCSTYDDIKYCMVDKGGNKIPTITKEKVSVKPKPTKGKSKKGKKKR